MAFGDARMIGPWAKQNFGLRGKTATRYKSYMISSRPSVARTPSLRREVVREALLTRIGDGELAPGERIVEARLAEEFAVSAIPVREAIRELVSMGVLEFANHRGAWVRVVSLPETIEALEVKAALEAQAAPVAARRLKGNGAELRTLSRRLAAAAKQRDFSTYQSVNHAFHRQIVQAGGNTLLLKMWESLAFEVRTRPIMEYLRDEDPVRIAREHEAIVAVLTAGNARQSAALLAAHATRLVKHLRSQSAACVA